MEKMAQKDMSGLTKIINTDYRGLNGGNFVPSVIEDMIEKSLGGRFGTKEEKEDRKTITFLGLKVVVGIKDCGRSRMLLVSAGECSIHPRSHHNSVQNLVQCLVTSGRAILLENKLIKKSGE